MGSASLHVTSACISHREGSPDTPFDTARLAPLAGYRLLCVLLLEPCLTSGMAAWVFAQMKPQQI